MPPARRVSQAARPNWRETLRRQAPVSPDRSGPQQPGGRGPFWRFALLRIDSGSGKLLPTSLDPHLPSAHDEPLVFIERLVVFYSLLGRSSVPAEIHRWAIINPGRRDRRRHPVGSEYSAVPASA